MLGSNIPEVGWPQSGEIDIMEYVSRLPNEIFGTIHGPGYQGGASFGNIYNFGEPVANDYHTYAVEWMPDLIIWYVDDIQYHQAVPADVAPNEWVFNHPFFMLLNQAIGGNFGGAISMI
jgi:beta-glucanase (GH16 family)